MRTIKIIVSGTVQGVFFRHETCKVARELNLKGYVRNLNNGSVEIVARGDEKAIYKLIEFARDGPSGASVTGIEVIELNESVELNPFTIRY